MSRDVWNIQVFEKWKASNNTEVYQRTCQKMMKMFSVLYCKLNLDSSVTISQWKTYFKSYLLIIFLKDLRGSVLLSQRDLRTNDRKNTITVTRTTI